MNNDELSLVSVDGASVVASVATDDFIKSRIFTIRGVQVMLDRDLASLYGVETSRLNEQVKRNSDRFPSTFMFQLTKEELAEWISQIATSNLDKSLKMGLRKLPRAFTEHGIIMLASVLKSGVAVAASIRITNAFVTMRRTLASMAPFISRLETVERRQITDQHLTPVAVAKFNKQNPTLTVKAAAAFHDRFLILDGKELYHFGASLKDLGRQYCAVTKMTAMFIESIRERISRS